MDYYFRENNISISGNNYASIKDDLLKTLNFIENSNDLEELLSFYTYLILFKPEILNNEFLSVVKNKLFELSSLQKEKWSKVQKLAYEYSVSSDALMRSSFDYGFFRRQKDIIDSFFNKNTFSFDKFTPLSDKNIYFILKKFYKDTNDYPSLCILYSLIDEKCIIDGSRKGSLGEVIFSNFTFNPYLKINRKNNFLDLITLVHEIGHIKYYYLALKDKNPIDINEFFYVKQYVEAYPLYQEKKFLDYLLSEGVFTYDVKHFLVCELGQQREYLEKLLDEPSVSDIRIVNGKIGGNLLKNISESNDLISSSADSSFFMNNFSKGERLNSVLDTINSIKKI